MKPEVAMKPEEIQGANHRLEGQPPRAVLEWACARFGADAVGIASSFSVEDQILAEAAAAMDPRPALFTLDTGRLFPETYDLIDATRERYGLAIEVLFPRSEDVEAMTAEHGVNPFYRSVELRKLCCRIRKVDLLRRRLASLEAWVTGLRRDQAVTRTELGIVEWDEANGLVKINPLAAWTEAEVWEAIRTRGIPYNALHDRGFPSIGCAPCTRAIAPGEDLRSGRWWWEQPEQKECGLHLRDGRYVSARGEQSVPDAQGASSKLSGRNTPSGEET